MITPGAGEKRRKESFIFKYSLSVCAAAVAESVTFPLDLTKTRLQIQGEGASRSHLQYRGVTATAFGIVREEGVRSLWRGVVPAVNRHVVYTGCRMAFYEWLRENVLKRDAQGNFPFWKAVIGGMTAGGMAQFLASPTDLIKVQMQMEGKRRLEGKPPRVRNMKHAVRQIISEGGLRGLWRGWVPNVQRAALVNLGDLTMYDTAKHSILNHTSLKDNAITHTLASICSGLLSAILGTPADVLKTRMMNQHLDGGKILYKSSYHCLKLTVKSEGFLALYKGFIPTWARMAPWSLTFWLVYEQIRRVTGTTSF